MLLVAWQEEHLPMKMGVSCPKRFFREQVKVENQGGGGEPTVIYLENGY